MSKNILEKFSSKVYLAPLAGVTDLAFRLRCLSYGAGFVSIPMINCNALVRNNKATVGLLKTVTEEKPKSVQLFGSKLQVIKKAAKIAVDLTQCDVLDFNMGCPDRNIVKQGAGASLLKRPKKIKEIVETLKSAVDVPISVKIRIGGSEKSLNVMKNSEVIEDAGADMLIIHGRTVKQGYSGKADWNVIKQVKENVSIPVVGNGDVLDEESAKKMFDDTGVDGVMVGRGALGKPYLFEKINYFLKYGKKISKKYDNKKEFLEYYGLCEKYDDVNFNRVKQNALRYTKGVVKGAFLRQKMGKCSKISDIIRLI